MLVLDTDTCVWALRHDSRVMARMGELSPDDVSVATITEGELWYGALRSRDSAAAKSSVKNFLSPIARLPFDSDAAIAYAELRVALRRSPIGERDLLIAAVVVSQGATLITHNTREFARVRGLTLDDWLSS